MSFADELKNWRGGMLVKEAAGALNVPLVTYSFWENERREPHELTKAEIRRRMQSVDRQTSRCVVC